MHRENEIRPIMKRLALLAECTGFAWKGCCETTVDELLCGNGSLLSKTAQSEKLLKDLLSEGEMLSEEITSQVKELDISNRTL